MAYDAMAARAARVEALGQRYEFTWGDPVQTFRIDPNDEWPQECIDLIGQQKIEAAFMLLLDEAQPGQADRLKKSGVRLRQADVEGILNDCTKFYSGQTLGE